jgi:transcription antitermination factor NusG
MNDKSILNKYARCGQSDSERWYVIYTRPNFEKRVDRNLKEFGFHSYLPLQKQLKCWNDRKAWVETPLFRSYIFIKTNLKKKDLAFKVDGILKYVSNGRKLAILSEKEINRIKQLCLHAGKIDILIEDIEIGKKVEISGGVLKGLKGYLTEVNDSRKVRIHIEGLNCFANVTIDSEYISLKHIS